MTAPKHGAREAFSLVEIVIALGLVSFAIVALLSLLSVGLKSSRQAEEDTRIAEMGGSVLARLSYQNPLPLGGTNLFFDADGKEVLSSSSAFYECAAAFRSPTEIELPSVGSNVFLVTLTFSWPADLAASARPFSATLHSAIAAP